MGRGLARVVKANRSRRPRLTPRLLACVSTMECPPFHCVHANRVSIEE
jgi:hypothetical protein